jgi:membrane-bound lytic murein transglycosylase B
MAAHFGRRLRKGAATTAVAAAAVAALSASQAPGVTVDGQGRQTSADATPSPEETADGAGATGNSPYYTDLPPLKSPNPSPTTGTGPTTPGTAEAGIPATVLDAYKKAEAALRESKPGCNLPWQLLAAIGKVESGQARGGRVTADGTTTSPIRGPQLDGNGFALIQDTDNGAYDGNSSYDQAVGPMQFIPSTWEWAGRDGNDDGREDPNNIYDAALAAGHYLCRFGWDLSEQRDLKKAILSYNNSTEYLNTVLSWLEYYRRDSHEIPDGTGTLPVDRSDDTDRVRPTTPSTPGTSTPGTSTPTTGSGSGRPAGSGAGRRRGGARGGGARGGGGGRPDPVGVVAAVHGQRAGAVRDLVAVPAVVLQPRQDGVQVLRRVVVAEDGLLEVALLGQVPAEAAQVVAGGERGVVDVVGVLAAVVVAVAARPLPGGRDELHGADGLVVGAVAVVGTVVGVLDEGEAVAVQLGAADRGGRRAVGGDASTAGLAGLHLADGGEQLPGQVAAGLGLAQRGLGLLVGVEDGRGNARLRRARGGGAGAGGRRRVGTLERRQVRVVGRVAGRAGAVGGLLGRGRGVRAGLSALAVDRHPWSLGRGQGRHRRRGHGGGCRSLAQPPAEMRRHRVNPSRERRSVVNVCRVRPVVTIHPPHRLPSTDVNVPCCAPSTPVPGTPGTATLATLRQLPLPGHPFMPDIHRLATFVRGRVRHRGVPHTGA